MNILCYLSAVLMLVVSEALVAFEFRNPFVLADVISCQIDEVAFFELRSKRFRQFSFSSHVSEYSVPSEFSVNFVSQSVILIPYSFNRGGNIELERDLNYCETFGKVGDIYYFWAPVLGGRIFILRPGEDRFVDVYPKSMSASSETFGSNSNIFLWGINRVKFISDRHFLVEQAGDYIDAKNCSLSSSLPVGECFPAMVRSAESFDGGHSWTDPVIVDEPTLFVLKK